MMLSNTVQMAKISQCVKNFAALTPAQRVFQHEETFVNLSQKRVRLVKMKREHIPLVIPVVKEFWQHEITAKSLDMKLEDEHLYPMLFDVTRDPYSYLILKNDEIVGHILQYAVYRNKEDDPNPLPKTKLNLKKDDKYYILENLVEFYERKVFELKPSTNSMVHSFASFLQPQYQAKGWMQQAGVAVARENLKLLDKGITALMGITSRKACETVGRKTGFEIIYEPPVEVYTQLNKGLPLSLVENADVATLLYFDLKENLKNPMFKL